MQMQYQTLVLSKDVKCARNYSGIYKKAVAKSGNFIFIIKFKTWVQT